MVAPHDTMTLGTGAGRSREDLVIDAAAAADLVRDRDCVVVGGSGSLLQVPETLLSAIGRRFAATGGPVDLDVVHVMGLGDHLGRGVDHLARRALVRRFIGSHFVLSPAEQALIARGEVEAIGLPAGTITLLYREIAAGRPGLLTDIGLDTFVDPRQQWGRMNEVTADGLSRVLTLDGREWLYYPTFPVHVALIRATDADSAGNLTMGDEAASSDNLAIAQAAHNSGGLVLAEVKRIVDAGTIPAAQVRVPGALVDHVVLTDFPYQTPVTREDPRRTGTRRNAPTQVPTLGLDHRKVIARRAAMELRSGQLANLGVGMANGISYVALEEGVLDQLTLTVEQGIFGGLPGIGLDSGTAVNPAAIIDMTSQFDLYDGGALDLAGLSFAQVDRLGNVNVTRVGNTPIGPGGFIDISQKARTVLFCGTFRGGDLQVDVDDSGVRIRRDGRYGKFVEQVPSITFSAARAHAQGQRVLYITERAVFQLGAHGVELIEVAPGINLRRDVLDQMGFEPVIPQPPALMDARLFRAGPMGLVLSPADTGRRVRRPL
ncbi:acyl CoA:acetate/3-ketoacid CoA transferase [Cellulomonas sp. 73-92]|uniref:acyl CoA:acetate/3-ketoacid CoA transferase n=1 Tax=Cellulomonas sp. 73-92 TaxID=1895740 RepID=UPI0025BC4116|nr:malonate decarboxylase subunit alpha [Cellulomonas sp. 73-92]